MIMQTHLSNKQMQYKLINKNFIKTIAYALNLTHNTIMEYIDYGDG